MFPTMSTPQPTSGNPNFLHNLEMWADRITSSVSSQEPTAQQGALHNEIVKLSQDEGLNHEQVARLCELSNHKMCAARFHKDPTGVFDLPVANKTAVLSDLVSHTKEARPMRQAVVGQIRDARTSLIGPPEQDPQSGLVRQGRYASYPIHQDYWGPPPPKQKKQADINAHTLFGHLPSRDNGLAGVQPSVPFFKSAASQEYEKCQIVAGILHQKLAAMQTEKGKSDKKVYDNVRSLILEGQKPDDVIEYVDKVDPESASGTSAKSMALLQQLKEDNLVAPEKEIVKDPTGKGRARMVNKDTSLADQLEENHSLGKKIALLSTAVQSVEKRASALRAGELAY